MKSSPITTHRSGVFVAACIAASGAVAQQQPQQQVSLPKAQAWIDIATFSGLGMAGGLVGMMGGGGSPLSMLGSMLGGGAQKNSFGGTQSMGAGRWVDVTLRAPGALQQAQLDVPPGFLSPALALQSPTEAPRQPVPDNEPDDKVVERPTERPKGKLTLYWGCGAAIRQGQPRVLDFATMSQADLEKFFVSRSATGRGAHATPGRPLWPNPNDARMVPEAARLPGEYRFSGSGVPENFRFQIPAAQDLMPALPLSQREAGGATELSWPQAPTARGFFVTAMGGGASSAGTPEMVMWTSSELPDTGSGLMDYQGNAAVDRWVREKVLLPGSATSCTVPAGIFHGQGGMLRLIAYGSELNLAFPPRPTDPRQRWDPDWAVKVRVKSVTMGMLGMPGMGMPGSESAGGGRPADEPAEKAAEKKPGAMDLLRGLLGR